MKRVIAAAALCGLALGLLAGCSGSSSGESASVQSVSSILSDTATLADRYAGKVVAGQTAEVKRDSDKTIQEVFVEEGDIVSAGDPLFSYDMEAMQLSLDKLKLEKENYENTISAAESEISELEKQLSSASSSDKLSYTLQIDTRNADIREAEYNISLKEREIAAMEEDMENTEITAPIDGRVMSVKEDDESESSYSDEDSGSETTFITIMDTTSFRVEGNISELNAPALTEGMAVIIRSRLDTDQTWSGTLSSIDWENPVDNSNNSDSGVVSYSSDSGTDDLTTATKYPFYIELDSADGLLLGQHVYIEPDTGDDEGSGLMLPSYYLVMDGDDTYVWAATDRDRLEKRTVTLRTYNEETDCYEITDGLALTDYIAFPDDTLTEGMTAEKYEETTEEDGGSEAESAAEG